jgi:hypothetical protein
MVGNHLPNLEGQNAVVGLACNRKQFKTTTITTNNLISTYREQLPRQLTQEGFPNTPVGAPSGHYMP